MIAQALVDTLVQLVLVLLVAFAVWGLAGRRRAGFFSWVGLTPPSLRALLWALVAAAILAPASLLAYFYAPLYALATGPDSVISDFAALGLTRDAAAMIAIKAVLQTALTEEIFFRGLIGKRLMNAFGFAAGNFLQSLVFCGLHLSFLLLPSAPPVTWPLVAVMTALIFP
ncbi:MAG: CPBP family glutamic-type intramembrane protease, partial [Pseudomonadota bacterium]